MKKWFKKTVAVVLTAAMAMTVGMPAFANGQDNQANEQGFYITDTTTLGEIVKYTNPEGYAAMPAERKAVLNETNMKDCLDAQENESQQPYAIYIEGGINPQISNIKSTSFDYAANLIVNAECPYMYLEAIIYDKYTGELVTSAYDADYNTYYLVIDETAEDLNPGWQYTFFVFGDVIPPEGYVTRYSDLTHTSTVLTAKG